MNKFTGYILLLFLTLLSDPIFSAQKNGALNIRQFEQSKIDSLKKLSDFNYQENINLRKIHFIKNENKNEKD